MVEIPEITFGALYREQYPLVLAYFLRRFDPDTAVDCAAEVFTVASTTFRQVASRSNGCTAWPATLPATNDEASDEAAG